MSDQPISISQRQARNLLISSQGLGEPFPDPDEAVRALFAVQTQYAASLGFAVAARVKRMKPSWPDDAFNRNPTLIKTWSLRSTVHVHLLSDRALVNAFNQPRYKQFLGWMKIYQDKNIRTHDNEDLMLAAFANGPLTRQELHAQVPQLKELGWTGWGADVKGLAFRGNIIMAPSGPGATRFVLANQWLPSSAEVSWKYEDAIAEIFRRYLRSHAPASVLDFMYWTAIAKTPVKNVIADVVKTFVPVKIEKMDGIRYILPEQVPLLESAPRASGVRLLAKFDPLMMAHKDKRLYLPLKHHKTVFQKAGQVEATVLIDGIVAGIWRITTKGSSGAIAIQPFRDYTPREAARVDKEANRLRRALGLKHITVDHTAVHVVAETAL